MTAESILFFLCLNDRGGAELSMLKIARELKARGRNVTLAVYGSQPQLAAELGFDGLVIDLKVPRTGMAFVKLFLLLWQRSFDTVISSLTHSNFAAIAAVFLLHPKTRVIVTEHGLDGVEACAASKPFALLAQLLYGHCFSVVAVSKALAARWRTLLPARATVLTIYNPVIGDEIPPMPAIHGDTPVILGIGRLKEEKNFALLIQAFALLKATRQARLVIIGEGEQRPMLEQQIADLGLTASANLRGFVTDPEAWLAQASLFVSPSRREGFGNALVEALALGVPVVATDCPLGPGEILEQGRYGWLVPMDDAAAMAQAMGDALDTPADAAFLRARARDFTVARCINAYAALLDNPATRT